MTLVSNILQHHTITTARPARRWDWSASGGSRWVSQQHSLERHHSNMAGGTPASDDPVGGFALRQPCVSGSERPPQHLSHRKWPQPYWGLGGQNELIMLYTVTERPKVDLTQTFQTLQVGIFPGSSRPVPVSEPPARAAGLPPPKQVLAGVGRRQSTEIRWSSHFRSSLPEALRHSTWLWTAAETLRRAYSASTEE